MQNQTKHPKVFISYAWTSKEYQQKVINLAYRLIDDGIDVILDVWDLKPGNDIISFMERCVNDKGISYVLMLLDEEYKKKADAKNGGVGTETQIISSEVYNNVEQVKFIPVVFQKCENVEMCIPTYLNTRLRFDLTQNDSEEQYEKLVKYLYGEEDNKKPPLGNKPAWVSESLNSPSSLNAKISLGIGDNSFNILEQEIKNSQLNEKKVDSIKYNEMDIEKANLVIDVYNSYLEYRNALIELFFSKCSDEKFVDDVSEFYENIKNWNKDNKGIKNEIWNSFIHETFIYLIAVLLKNEQYEKIYKFITKSYFVETKIYKARNFFYNSGYNEKFSKAKKTLDNKNYINGLAQIWIENIYEQKVTKTEFTRADLLIYNLTILLYENDWTWFPQTYIYDSEFNYTSSIVEFSKRLQSKDVIRRTKDLFGIKDVEGLKLLLEKMNDFNSREYRYPCSFNPAPVILDYINIDEIGAYN